MDKIKILQSLFLDLKKNISANKLNAFFEKMHLDYSIFLSSDLDFPFDVLDYLLKNLEKIEKIDLFKNQFPEILNAAKKYKRIYLEKIESEKLKRKEYWDHPLYKLIQNPKNESFEILKNIMNLSKEEKKEIAPNGNLEKYFNIIEDDPVALAIHLIFNLNKSYLNILYEKGYFGNELRRQYKSFLEKLKSANPIAFAEYAQKFNIDKFFNEKEKFEFGMANINKNFDFESVQEANEFYMRYGGIERINQIYKFVTEEEPPSENIKENLEILADKISNNIDYLVSIAPFYNRNIFGNFFDYFNNLVIKKIENKIDQFASAANAASEKEIKSFLEYISFLKKYDLIKNEKLSYAIEKFYANLNPNNKKIFENYANKSIIKEIIKEHPIKEKELEINLNVFSKTPEEIIKKIKYLAFSPEKYDEDYIFKYAVRDILNVYYKSKKTNVILEFLELIENLKKEYPENKKILNSSEKILDYFKNLFSSKFEILEHVVDEKYFDEIINMSQTEFEKIIELSKDVFKNKINKILGSPKLDFINSDSFINIYLIVLKFKNVVIKIIPDIEQKLKRFKDFIISSAMGAKGNEISDKIRDFLINLATKAQNYNLDSDELVQYAISFKAKNSDIVTLKNFYLGGKMNIYELKVILNKIGQKILDKKFSSVRLRLEEEIAKDPKSSYNYLLFLKQNNAKPLLLTKDKLEKAAISYKDIQVVRYFDEDEGRPKLMMDFIDPTDNPEEAYIKKQEYDFSKEEIANKAINFVLDTLKQDLKKVIDANVIYQFLEYVEDFIIETRQLDIKELTKSYFSKFVDLGIDPSLFVVYQNKPIKDIQDSKDLKQRIEKSKQLFDKIVKIQDYMIDILYLQSARFLFLKYIIKYHPNIVSDLETKIKDFLDKNISYKSLEAVKEQKDQNYRIKKIQESLDFLVKQFETRVIIPKEVYNINVMVKSFGDIPNVINNISKYLAYIAITNYYYTELFIVIREKVRNYFALKYKKYFNESNIIQDVKKEKDFSKIKQKYYEDFHLILDKYINNLSSTQDFDPIVFLTGYIYLIFENKNFKEFYDKTVAKIAKLNNITKDIAKKRLKLLLAPHIKNLSGLPLKTLLFYLPFNMKKEKYRKRFLTNFNSLVSSLSSFPNDESTLIFGEIIKNLPNTLKKYKYYDYVYIKLNEMGIIK